jgi:hypothetical protein
MLNDCDRIRSAAKATRATRVKQPKSADKQIARVQYKKEDTEYKLVSIPPIKVVGGTRLFTFNTKTRVISEYITQDTKGFEISGTTTLIRLTVGVAIYVSRLSSFQRYLIEAQSKSIKHGMI